MIDSATLLSQALVVVRGIGERTEGAVVNLFKDYVDSDNVVVVTGAPFSVTLRRSFEVAIDRGLPWTFCVDADVLVFPDSVPLFCKAARVAPGHLYGIQGLVLDKWFGGMRSAGIRIYRTELLEQAMAFIPRGEDSKRPETFVRRQMQARGYEYLSSGIFCGLHDFEQYYRDVYRTAFFHGQKHRQFAPILRTYWGRMSKHDPDFLVALRGVDDGLREDRVLGLDARNFSERAGQVLADLGLEEKSPFTPTIAEMLAYMENAVAGWETPPEFDEFYRMTKRPSRVGRWLGPTLLRRLGLSGVLEQ